MLTHLKERGKLIVILCDVQMVVTQAHRHGVMDSGIRRETTVEYS